MPHRRVQAVDQQPLDDDGPEWTWNPTIPYRLVLDKRLSPLQKEVAFYLAYRCGPSGSTHISTARIAEDLGRDIKAVRRAIAALVALGVIVRTPDASVARHEILSVSWNPRDLLIGYDSPECMQSQPLSIRRSAACITPSPRKGVSPLPSEGSPPSPRKGVEVTPLTVQEEKTSEEFNSRVRESESTPEAIQDQRIESLSNGK
jgi:hypothetical protein